MGLDVVCRGWVTAAARHDHHAGRDLVRLLASAADASMPDRDFVRSRRRRRRMLSGWPLRARRRRPARQARGGDRSRRPGTMVASVRNFGFITVTGQAREDMWPRATRSAEVWAEVAAEADIPVLHRGLLLATRRQESVAVLEDPSCRPRCQAQNAVFLDAGRGRRKITRSLAYAGASRRALESPRELRVEFVARRRSRAYSGLAGGARTA